jgi:MFS family permease
MKPHRLKTPNGRYDPRNPWNWSRRKKSSHPTCHALLCWASSVRLFPQGRLLLTTPKAFGTTIIAPARECLMDEFHVGGTVALLPFSLCILALGFGPVVGGPLSETIGRYPVYLTMLSLGALFMLGAGFTHTIRFSLCAALSSWILLGASVGRGKWEHFGDLSARVERHSVSSHHTDAVLGTWIRVSKYIEPGGASFDSTGHRSVLLL